MRPFRYALDMYGYIPEWMPKMIPEFVEAGIDDPKIIILETYWNDAKALKDLHADAQPPHGTSQEKLGSPQSWDLLFY